MFILTSDQISPCTVTTGDNTESKKGIEFKQKVFALSMTYTQQEYKTALNRCRQFLDQGVFCIIVQEANKLSLWIQQVNLQKVEASNAPKPMTYRGSVVSEKSKVVPQSGAMIKPSRSPDTEPQVIKYRGQILDK
jgi:hypothetical protein